MKVSARKPLWIIAGVAVVAATVRAGAGIVSRGGGCQAGQDPAPKGAPPFPQGPTDRRGVWAINADGSGESRLQTGQPGGWPTMAAIALSPDGNRIAYVDAVSFSLRVSNIDGQVRELVGGAATPTWSPNGSQIAFVSNTLDVINADGSGRRSVVQIDPNGQPIRDPAWSPDGKHIAYAGWDGRDAIRIADTEGSQPKTVTAHDHFRLSHPTWSPDSRRIAFAAGGGYYGSWLGVVRTDGTGLHRIAAHCGGGNPSWSADGTKIAYEDFYGINIINADGSHRLRVPNSWYGHQPTWSPDGKQILFFRY